MAVIEFEALVGRVTEIQRLDNLVAFVEALETVVVAGADDLPRAAGGTDVVGDVFLVTADGDHAGLEVILEFQIEVLAELGLEGGVADGERADRVVGRGGSDEGGQRSATVAGGPTGAGLEVGRQIVSEVDTRERFGVATVDREAAEIHLGAFEMIGLRGDRGGARAEIRERVGVDVFHADATEDRQAADFGAGLNVGGVDAFLHDAAIGVLLGGGEVHVFIPEGAVAQRGADRRGIDHGEAFAAAVLTLKLGQRHEPGSGQHGADDAIPTTR